MNSLNNRTFILFVKLVEEMTDLIVGQRAYEANSKSIQTADSMLQTVNGLKRN